MKIKKYKVDETVLYCGFPDAEIGSAMAAWLQGLADAGALGTGNPTPDGS